MLNLEHNQDQPNQNQLTQNQLNQNQPNQNQPNAASTKKIDPISNRYIPGEVFHPMPFEYNNFFKIIDQSDLNRLKHAFSTDVEKYLKLSTTALNTDDDEVPILAETDESGKLSWNKLHTEASSSARSRSNLMTSKSSSSHSRSSHSNSTSSSSSSSSSSRSSSTSSRSCSLISINSTFDDSDADPNFEANGDDEASSDCDDLTRRNTRKKRKNPREWKTNKAKKKCNLGKTYNSKNTGKEVDRKKMRPGCNEKCIFICSSKITEAERFSIFRKYWDLGDVTKRRDFISRCIKEIKKSSIPTESTHRNLNVAYYFKINGMERRVCKNYFTATLDISSTTVTTVRSKLANGLLEEDKRGKHGKQKKLPDSVREGIRDHINSIPRIPSHYLRAQSEREYIDGGRTIAQIYRDYVENCKMAGKPFAMRTVFYEVFNEFNISFFIPKKDQCELCSAYENNKENKLTEYQEHLKEKELSRVEKEKDKNNKDETSIVSVFDLQAALPTPRSEVSVFYYRSKLSTYNLSIYNLKTNQAVCNVWHEGEGHRGAVEICSAVYQYIANIAGAASGEISFIFYTDNCAGQQKNRYLIMMYMYALCMFRNIRAIEHKFLIKGHTQNEGDTVHSVIEKEIKRTLKSGPITVPSQYYQIMRTAKKKAPFYKVNEISFTQFIDFKSIGSELGENFSINTNNESVPFAKIKILNITQENPFTFRYKTSYQEEEFKLVNIFQSNTTRKNTRASGVTLTIEENVQKLKDWRVKKAYNSRIPIAPNKKKDLMFLVNNNYIKQTYFDFYNSL